MFPRTDGPPALSFVSFKPTRSLLDRPGRWRSSALRPSTSVAQDRDSVTSAVVALHSKAAYTLNLCPAVPSKYLLLAWSPPISTMKGESHQVRETPGTPHMLVVGSVVQLKQLLQNGHSPRQARGRGPLRLLSLTSFSPSPTRHLMSAASGSSPRRWRCLPRPTWRRGRWRRAAIAPMMAVLPRYLRLPEAAGSSMQTLCPPPPRRHRPRRPRAVGDDAARA